MLWSITSYKNSLRTTPVNDRLLLQENRFLGQYLIPEKLNASNGGVQDTLYETYKTDLSKKRDFDNEILRRQTKWSHSTDENQVTLTETLQHANPDLYPDVDTIITILLTMPVSTATPERSLARCARMRRVKTYLRSTVFHDENRANRITCPDACLQET